jgi:hypothetical protein
MTNVASGADEIRARNRATIDRILADPAPGEPPWFANGEVVGSCLADDFVFELPFAPNGEPKAFGGKDRDEFFTFLMTSVLAFSYIKTYLFETNDPCVFITEDEAEGTVTWRGGGVYHQRHMTLLRCDQEGKLQLWREYCSPNAYFYPVESSDENETSVPEWDYNEERVRVGLDPGSFTWDQTHVMPPLE